MLQNVWVSGGAARRGQGPAPKPVTAKVTPTGSAPVEGRVVRIDDFLITLALADGSQRTFAREGDVPKVEVYNPRAGHLALLSQLSDKNMHDVTAYLVTLK
jgi:cytochrome c oxidase cbb3-type subunit 3